MKKQRVRLIPSRPGARGFTLMELIIVLVILGILAAVAIPLISSNTIRGYAAEAKHILTAIRESEFRARQEANTTVFQTMDKLDVDIKGDGVPNPLAGEATGYFTYTITTAAPGTATATGGIAGTPLVAGDTMKINLTTGALTCAGQLVNPLVGGTNCW
ncbi:MAG: prepilin-type N-terminal cleavage/methylation domain-containing protein [Candidatus Omnitrophica bacterium]|nr:prepilin-type N-terminal cleavage/methylation domain-containing protein [Candidatus Omnitrophota bacterium]